MSRRPGQPKFSTLWKIFFHSVEKSRKSFPYRGKPGWSGGVPFGETGEKSQ